MVKVIFRTHPAEIRKFLAGPQGPAYKLVKDAVDMTEDRSRQWIQRLGLIDTGNMMGSFVKSPILVQGSRVIGSVENTADYAMYVHEGTRPHIIVPRRARMLAWVPRGGGSTIFASKVHHPGTKPRPFLTSAAKEVAQRQGMIFTGK